MRKNRVFETLQGDITIPNIVQKRADLVFEQIKKDNGGKRTIYSGKVVQKGMWAAVAAAVLLLGTVAYAAYMNWSYGMQEELNPTQEQKAFLEDNQFVTPMNNSVTREGVTITLQQSIVDARFALLSFKVEGYDVRQGSIWDPDFENMNVTVDGDDCGMVNSGFFYNWHITEDERVYTDTGLPIEERVDGSLIERYTNKDGNMEYIVSFMTDSKDNSLIGKTVHVAFYNLGTRLRHSDVYRNDIDAAWDFDFALEGSDQVRSLELSQPLGDSGATVTKAEISPISLYVEYDFPMQEVAIDTIDDNGKLGTTTTFATAPSLTGVRLKDGTLLTGICNGGSEGYEENDRIYVSYALINHVLDPEDVDALLFIKSIPEAGSELTEENLYIAPF